MFAGYLPLAGVAERLYRYTKSKTAARPWVDGRMPTANSQQPIVNIQPNLLPTTSSRLLFTERAFAANNYLRTMQEGKRQKQVGGLLYEELNGIFQRLGLTMIDGGMVSLSTVRVTPDLLEARIYLSLFQVKDQNAVLKKIQDRSWEIKKELTARVGKQLRRMPVLQFFLDDTLEQVFKMEELFKKINDDKSEK